MDGGGSAMIRAARYLDSLRWLDASLTTNPLTCNQNIRACNPAYCDTHFSEPFRVSHNLYNSLW